MGNYRVAFSHTVKEEHKKGRTLEDLILITESMLGFMFSLKQNSENTL